MKNRMPCLDQDSYDSRLIPGVSSSQVIQDSRKWLESAEETIRWHVKSEEYRFRPDASITIGYKTIGPSIIKEMESFSANVPTGLLKVRKYRKWVLQFLGECAVGISRIGYESSIERDAKAALEQVFCAFCGLLFRNDILKEPDIVGSVYFKKYHKG